MRLPLAAGLATAAVAVTLYPLFENGSWVWACLGAIAMVTLAGTVTTRYTLPRWLAPLGGLLLLGWYLLMGFAREEAWAGLVPTPDALILLWTVLESGFADVQRYAAPVPVSPGLSLLTAGGVGLIALLVDLFAVRMRRAALAGLPLLALFSVPAAFIVEPLGWPAVLIAALGYLGLLLADGRERIGHWGRPVPARGPARAAAAHRPDTTRLRLSGKRIGFTAAALAVAVPVLVPGLEPTPLFGFGAGNGTGPGGNTITIPNPIAGMRGMLARQDNATVLTYRSSDDAPHYLRLYALDRFDGEEWTMTPPRGRPEDRVSEGALPPAPGLGAGVRLRPVETRITVSQDIDSLSFLPLPYPPTLVRAEGDWRADRDTLMVFSTSDDAAGLEYTVTSSQPEPTPETLDAAAAVPEDMRERYLALPASLPAEIGRIAEEVTREGATAYRKAVLLQEWFTTTGGFTYSLATEGMGNDALLDFVTDGRTGYCEQFAAAMAVMARAVGIPSRVAVGYTGGAGADGLWEVRTGDAHAWPELYFEGVGWLRFEPTPAGGAGQGSAVVPQYTRPRQSEPERERSGTAAESSPSAAPGSSAAPTGSAAGGPNPRQADRGLDGLPYAAEESTPLALRIGAWAGAALLLALAPAGWRAATRARRRRAWSRPPEPAATGRAGTGAAARAAGPRPGAVHAAWAELCDVLYDLGLARRSDETPRALARRLTEQYELDPDTTAAIARIATAEERLRYARTPGVAELRPEDVPLVRRALARNVSRGRRVRARLAPPSTLLRLRRIGGKVLDGFDLLENLRVRPRRDRDTGMHRSAGEPADRELTRAGR